MGSRLALGLDFGTESVRALLVDVRSGEVAGQGTSAYAHGVIDRELLRSSGASSAAVPLPPDYALQHPQDWLESAAAACRQALAGASIDASTIVGIGVDFTSC